MNFRYTTVIFLLFIGSFVSSGCSPTTEQVAALSETVVVGPEYTAKGIYVPDETRRSLGLKVVEIGEEKIAATLELALRVYAMGPGVVRASTLISPEEASALKPAQVIEITGRGENSGTGAITAIRGGGPHDVAGQVEVLAEIVGDKAIPVGSFVSGRVTVGGGDAVTSVPRSAVIHGVEGPFVYTVSGDRFVRTHVVVGAVTDNVAEIRDGLYSGDEVVSEPAMSLWLTELAAIKGGHACCAVPAKGR